MEEDDPVVEEHDLFVSTQLAPYLHILRLPGNFNELEGVNSTVGRYKQNHKLLELEFPLDTSRPTYSKSRGEELALASITGRIHTKEVEISTMDSMATERLDTMRLAGTKVSLGENSKYFVAVAINDAIHMTPVENVLCMRPYLKYLDESDAKTKQMARKLNAADGPSEEKLRAVQVQFKKRETEEQIAARLSSFAYLQRQVEEEAWIPLAHYPSSASESQTVSERLVSPNAAPIEFKANE